MSELKKCPCCPDGKGKLWAAYDGTYCVQCDKCGLTTLHKFSKQDVIAAWNRRAQPENKPLTCDVAPVVRGEWKQGREFPAYPRVPFIGDAYYCSNCEEEAYWDTDYGQQLFNFCPNCGAKMEVKE